VLDIIYAKWQNISMAEYKYCNSYTQFARRKTIEVKIGNTAAGSNYPVRLQSMTNTITRDVNATVDQCKRIIDAGADYVRITIPSLKDAECLKDIKAELRDQGYDTPLIADIHFSPDIAEYVAAVVEKVRINPGNYAENRKNAKADYSDDEYLSETVNLKSKIIPLINICKKNNTALRIGTNHGSLSGRIMGRYGDTPEGMAESAMEYLRICREEHFDNIILSMKSSNTMIMVQSVRLLVRRMLNKGMHYPLHLGVTEAGEGDDGRIKSAVGIGALMADGMGDTIRISLTEEPEAEISVAKKLVGYFSKRDKHKPVKPLSAYPLNPYEYQRRITESVFNTGGRNHPVVVADLSNKDFSLKTIAETGWSYNADKHRWTFSDQAADFIYLNEMFNSDDIPEDKGIILDHKKWNEYKGSKNSYFPLYSLNDYLNATKRSERINFVKIFYDEFDDSLIKHLKKDSTVILVSVTDNANGYAEQRALCCELINRNYKVPVIFKRDYYTDNREDFMLMSSADTGGLFLDGLGDGIWLNNKGDVAPGDINSTAFGILQASRARISKAEYISCPSCGRTNFNIQEVVARIREKTSHLKELKIAVMGCIVNGPGEMADADYGYVGSGKNKVTLYKAREIVKKNIPEEKAVDELISIIKMNGDWK
jgi:(E)-4-hydroxy-3-methylbut-2-enyl-diphosphate synthase